MMNWRDKCIMLAVGVALLGATLAVRADDESKSNSDGVLSAETAQAPKPKTAPVKEPVEEKAAVETKKPGLDRGTVLIASLTIFVLAVFIGFELITKVPPTLHTPLMSGSNAISGITVVGAILSTGVGTPGWGWVSFFGFLAVILAAINAVGGFAVTHRMLAMFQKR
jgi:NAD(P) transhydrogenase subunit alpha